MNHCNQPAVSRRAAMVFIAAAALSEATTAQPGEVIVNGLALDARARQLLELSYRTRLAPARYWYDPVSGLWGLEGAPSSGQIAPGLRVGGQLNPQASVGRFAGVTRVFVNGREIPPQELRYLEGLYGNVRRARYWLNARGIGGYEGGPALFDLRATANARQAQANNGSYTRRGAFGNTGSDGQCGYFFDPSSGASVMTGRC